MRLRTLSVLVTAALTASMLVDMPAAHAAVSDGEPIANLTLDVAPANGRAGISQIPTSGINLGLLPLVTGELESAPLRSSPLRSSPLRSSPLRSSPLRSSPLRSSPLRSSPLRSSPLRSSPITAANFAPIPLSTVPLLLDGGWDARLVGTPSEGVSLQAILLTDVIELANETNPDTSPKYPLLASLTLGDIDITATPLRSSPLMAFLFAGPTLHQLSPATTWCGGLLDATFCSSKGITDTTAGLLDVINAGANGPGLLSSVSGLPVAGSDLTGSPMAGYDVGSVDLTSSPLGTLPVNGAGFPAGMVDCTKVASATATLAQAIAANAIVTDPTLSAYRRILAVPSLVGTVTFGDLIRTVLDPSKLDYSNIRLDALLDQAPLDRASLVRYTAQADVQCDDARSVDVTVQLPPDFRYLPGSSTRSLDSAAQIKAADPVGAPQSDGPRNRQRWTLPLSCRESGIAHLMLTFQAQPGVTLGLQTSSVFASYKGSQVSLRDVAPFGVQEVFEANNTPATATPVTSGVLYLSHISTPGDIDYYRLPTNLPAGTRVSAVLSHLPDDFDLFLNGPSAAPLRSSPLRSSPLRSSPIEDPGASGNPGGESIQPENVQDLPLRSSVLSTSASADTTSESVTTVLTAGVSARTPVTLAVAGHLKNSSNSPYMLQVFTDPPPTLNCPSPFSLGNGNGVNGTLPNLNANQRNSAKTLFIVNEKRFGDLYGRAQATAMHASLAALAARPEVNGVILSVEANNAVNQAYTAWNANRCSPEAANNVVRAIGTVIDGYSAQMRDLRYITIVGDDDVIPFARIPDSVSISNQRDYYPEVDFANVDNPISAAFAYSYLLSDNILTTKSGIAFLGHQLPVPDYAGGRLVETPAQIQNTITQYLAKPYVDLSTTLTTGYDFIADGAQGIDSSFANNGGKTLTHDALISETWTKQDLTDRINTNHPTVASVNAHYDHSNSLPAIGNTLVDKSGDLFSSTDLTNTSLPPGALLFTMGCQSGLNVPGLAWASASTPEEKARLVDFAEAAATKSAAGYMGNTGFGYGDTAAVAYSERFINLFAGLLDGTRTVGQAMVEARKDYLQTVLPGVYDEKVLNESTFYGLPFLTVGPTGTTGPAPAPPAPGTVNGSDPLLGQFQSFGVNPTYTPVTNSRGTYFTVANQAPLVEHLRPIQPQTTVSLPNPPSGTGFGDPLITELTSLPDVTGFDPVIDVPTVDQGSFQPEPVVTSVNFPVSLGQVTPTGTLDLFTGEYRSDPSTPGTGRQLRFSHMAGRVFYPTAANPPRPTFDDVQGIKSGGGVNFTTDVSDAQFVLVLFKRAGSPVWGSLSLTQTSPGIWTGRVPNVQIEEYFVQAVNQGRVGITRAKGLNYSPTPEVDIRVTGRRGNGPWFVGPATIDVTATGDTGQPVPFQAFVDGQAAALPATVSDDGVHDVTVTGNGTTGRRTVAVDATPPTVHFFNPPNGGTLPGGSVQQASFTCSDVDSGVATCQALDPMQLDTNGGTHAFRVKVTDNAGNSVIQTATYTVDSGYRFAGFFPPVANAPKWNGRDAGSTVPVRFRLFDLKGVPVTRLDAVQRVQSVRVDCVTGETDIDQPEDAVSWPALRYDDGDHQYVFNWKTERSWSNTCRKLVVTFDDGTSHVALFRFHGRLPHGWIWTRLHQWWFCD